ncbi:MAG TPA: UDP-N-acetylmuramate dehydrogenase [Halothiobacillaceae bacterium]|nr:UDP-N-acetylmuramate dehydrogenase [Halothiobacillaceae bacterium]
MLQLRSEQTLENTLRLPAVSKAHYELDAVDAHSLASPGLKAILKDPDLLIIGGGSNLVFASPEIKHSLSISANHWQVLRQSPSHVWIVAEAGLSLDVLVRQTTRYGWFGLERLAEIPGTIGAAPIQNVGAYGREIADLLNWVEAVDRKTGQICRFTRAACRFSYRQSIFKQQPERWLITRVGLRLKRKSTADSIFAHPGVQHAAKQLGYNIKNNDIPADPKVIAEIIRAVRLAKLPDWRDPHAPGSVGSFFHNPVISRKQFNRLRKKFGAVPGFATADQEKIKIPAGWLIEQRGWRGVVRGSVGVYADHALVLVHFGAGSGAELLSLANEIIADIKNHYGITLVIEPRVLP